MMLMQDRAMQKRVVITAFCCVVAHVVTKVWTGTFSGNNGKIIYPKDPRYVEIQTKAPVKTTDSGEFLLNFTDFSPQVVWLMSFPNSGTSFTMNNVRKVTNRSIASNYADEVTVKGKISLPLYPFHDEGPFWSGAVKNEIVTFPKELPDKYVLTKTHCGSRCDNCGPASYIEPLDSFAKWCATGHARLPDGDKNMKRTMVTYPFDRVAKAIHLIRNPYNNLVARFHLIYKQQTGKQRVKFLARHPNNATGFKEWCRDHDKEYAQEDKDVFGKDEELYKIVTDVPCHGELYKYVQWHNLAIETTEQLKIPTLIVHYEEYEGDFNVTVAKILDFLEMPAEGEPKDFYPGHAYDDFFTSKERQAVKKFTERIASPQALKYLERYL